MNTLTHTWTGGVPGFCEGLPSGQFIFNIPGTGVRTDHGLLPLPGANSSASYCRLADDGVRILCQGQEDNRAWVYVDRWYDTSLLAWGTDATMFGPDGNPIINDTSEKWAATGGLRAVINGQVVNCNVTYADPARGLYQYQDYGDVAIGQGGDDIGEGAVVRFADDGILRRFATGTIRNM